MVSFPKPDFHALGGRIQMGAGAPVELNLALLSFLPAPRIVKPEELGVVERQRGLP